ncbi:hypothetical protein [Streptomyces sp. NBC_00454]|uniref:hypothetical protein n=1 Tax=Streptomyces sp. NBC_00454 TaxID=2975747 RepID=UPI0030E157C3
MPRNAKKPRRLVVDGRVYMWTMSHRHRRDEDGRAVDCRQTLTLSPQPSGSGGPLRVVFADGPGRYVPGGAPFGSGDVGFTRGADLNLHEPRAVRALLDEALARGWRPDDRRPVEVDGWTLIEAAALRAGGTGTGTGTGTGPTAP